jgi:hypothetical protein
VRVRVRVSRVTIIIMISSLLEASSDGLNAVLVQTIEKITYKVPKSDHNQDIPKEIKTG